MILLLISVVALVVLPLVCRYFYLKKPEEFNNKKGYAIAACIIGLIVFCAIPIWQSIGPIKDINENSIVTVKITEYEFVKGSQFEMMRGVIITTENGDKVTLLNTFRILDSLLDSKIYKCNATVIYAKHSCELLDFIPETETNADSSP